MAWRKRVKALDYPVVAGNVSLYNETNGVAIPPTPAIGGVGLHSRSQPGQRTSRPEERMATCSILLGKEEGHLGQSLFQQIIVGKLEGAPPPVDLELEIAAGHYVRDLIRSGGVAAVHDVSDGGLLTAVTEMAFAGDRGVQLYNYEGRLPAHAIWFGEDQGRYVLEVSPSKADDLLAGARDRGLDARIIGRVGGDEIRLGSGETVALSQLRDVHEGWLPDYMSARS